MTTDPTTLAIHGAICEDSIEECLDCGGMCVKAARAGAPRTIEAPETIEASSIQPWPEGSSIVAITGDDGSELLAILSNGIVRGVIENAGPAAERFITGLRGLSETIAAQAKAEALREAAEYIDAGDYADMNPDGTMRPRLTQVQISQRNRTVTANWLRARAATIEGGSE